MSKKMETLYSGLESYYVFDKQKYTLEEFMSDIKKFKDQFKVTIVYFLCPVSFLEKIRRIIKLWYGLLTKLMFTYRTPTQK